MLYDEMWGGGQGSGGMGVDYQQAGGNFWV